MEFIQRKIYFLSVDTDLEPAFLIKHWSILLLLKLYRNKDIKLSNIFIEKYSWEASHCFFGEFLVKFFLSFFVL